MQIEDFFPPPTELNTVIHSSQKFLILFWFVVVNERCLTIKAGRWASCGSGRAGLSRSMCFCQGLGAPTVTRTVCSLGFGERTYLPLLKLVAGGEGACRGIPQGMGEVSLLFVVSLYQTQKLVRGYRVCKGTGSVVIHRGQSWRSLFPLSPHSH